MARNVSVVKKYMTPYDIHIREALLSDAAVIADLVRKHAAGAVETSPISAAYVAAYLQSPQNRILLAAVNDRVIGLLSYSIRPDLYHAADTCLIEELIVEKNAREQGAAGMLVAELIHRLEKTACIEISVSVIADNASAIRFYKSHGLTDEFLYLERHF